MKLLLDILQGMGLATAAGLRPFLPALVAGGLALGNFGIDFEGTDFAFLESPILLAAAVLGLIAAVVLERRSGGGSTALQSAIAGLGIGLGALLFAGSLADRHETWWPGLLGGLACAALASYAARRLLGRVRGRLDRDAQGALPVYADGGAGVLAALSVLVPPISLVALGFVARLLVAGRRRAGEKYAGLRILR